jgi:hypothetical protein
MTAQFEVRVPAEQAFRRRVLLALELLDAVTLSRVTEGVKVTAEGLKGKPLVNTGGSFVWLEEDVTPLKRIVIDTGRLPLEGAQIAAMDVQLPLTSIELSPRAAYDFAPGITALRGTLIEERVAPPDHPQPVAGAAVHLLWLDDNNQWIEAPTVSHSEDPAGDFAALLRLTPAEIPLLDADGALTARLRVRRGNEERGSGDLKLAAGRVADASASNPLVFAWDELEP